MNVWHKFALNVEINPAQDTALTDFVVNAHPKVNLRPLPVALVEPLNKPLLLLSTQATGL